MAKADELHGPELAAKFRFQSQNPQSARIKVILAFNDIFHHS